MEFPCSIMWFWFNGTPLFHHLVLVQWNSPIPSSGPGSMELPYSIMWFWFNGSPPVTSSGFDSMKLPCSIIWFWLNRTSLFYNMFLVQWNICSITLLVQWKSVVSLFVSGFNLTFHNVSCIFWSQEY